MLLSEIHYGLSHLLFFAFAAMFLQNLDHDCFALASPIEHGGADALGAPAETLALESHVDPNKLGFFIHFMKNLQVDQAVTASDKAYSARAMTFATQNNKVFISDAWEPTFLNFVAFSDPEKTSELEGYMLMAFALKSKGYFYVVGKPKSMNSEDSESKNVFRFILGLLKLNPNAKGLIIVNPADFKQRRTIVWSAKKSASDSTISNLEKKIISELPTGEEANESQNKHNLEQNVEDQIT